MNVMASPVNTVVNRLPNRSQRRAIGRECEPPGEEQSADVKERDEDFKAFVVAVEAFPGTRKSNQLTRRTHADH
jgi:hypothetical protein